MLSGDRGKKNGEKKLRHYLIQSPGVCGGTTRAGVSQRCWARLGPWNQVPQRATAWVGSLP